MNVYRDVLGESWELVSAKVRRSHLDGDALDAACSLEITGADHWLGRLLARLLAFPAPSPAAPVALRVRSSPQGEIWERGFPDCVLRSVQRAAPGHLIDRFTLFSFWFRLEVKEGAILHHHARTYLRVAGIELRLPRRLAPSVVSREDPDQDAEASRIFVNVAAPLAGNILTYRGIVRPMRSDT